MAVRKVSHLQESQKDQQPNPEAVKEAWRRHEVEKLAFDVAAVLENPSCPEKLYTGITDALSEIETHADTLSVDFLFGLLLSKPRQAEEKGGAA